MGQLVDDDGSLVEYEHLLDKIRGLQDRIENEIMPQMNALIAGVAGRLMGGALVATKLRLALSVIDGFCDQIGTLVESGGVVFRLRDDEQGWYRIDALLVASRDDFSTTTPKVVADWRGTAADAYERANRDQLAALEALRSAYHSMAGELQSARGDAFLFYVTLLILVATVAALLSLALGQAADPLSWPSAVSSLIAAITTAAMIPSLVSGGAKTFDGHAHKILAILDGLHVDPPFPGGHWPSSGSTAYRAGSVSNGDPSDWRVYHADTGLVFP
jgi:hypothetical protein